MLSYHFTQTRKLRSSKEIKCVYLYEENLDIIFFILVLLKDSEHPPPLRNTFLTPNSMRSIFFLVGKQILLMLVVGYMGCKSHNTDTF